MLLYYASLPKDRGREFDANIKASYAVMKTAKTAFGPFEWYLENAIEALKKKEDIKAKWRKIDTSSLAELKIIGGLFEIPKQTFVQFEETTLEGAQIGENIMGSIGVHKILTKNGTKVTFDVVPQEDEMLFRNNKQLKFTIIPPQKPAATIIREEQQRYVVYSQKELVGANRIQDYKSVSFVDFNDLRFENGKKLEAERNEGLSLVLENENDLGKTVVSNQIKFSLEKARKNNKDAWWIQLVECNASADEDIPGFSPLQYFFDDDITVVDEKKNEYQVAAGIESENKIVLSRKDESKKGQSRWEFCFPPEGSTLRVKVNTYSLDKQRESIRTLLQMPVGDQAKLIKLFENRDRVSWENPGDTPVDEWVVITDEDRSGVDEQRKFIKQALNTPDFAILEGPPGSGKTTVILELICQLAKQGKRILLCGSTHVAIDNVLERLKEQHGEKSLLERFHILPVRIGDAKRINEDIHEFQLDNLIKNNGIDQTLLLDASNLVCGTTIGILQHPKFRERSKNWRDTPIVPEFDYLIIDESSKTTFQEFLVPALYAKKWILAGDVMQLSPFADRDEIVANIEQSLDDVGLKQAIFYLHKLKDCFRGQHNKFVLPVPEGIIETFLQELEAGRLDDFRDKVFFFIAKWHEDGENLIFRTPEEVNTLELSAADLIVVAENQLEEILPLIPETHAVLRSKTWSETEHAFIHNAHQKQYAFQYGERGRELGDSSEIVKQLNAYFQERSWAEEIAWRADREHQLRMVRRVRQKGNYGRVIQELLPKSKAPQQVEGQINQIASIAFPSILESLVKGISGRKAQLQSTISEGFSEKDLGRRKTTLAYQHRMHPEISRFPRERFYRSESEEALLDLEHPCCIGEMRAWGYNKYAHRSEWVDVRGKTQRNYNQEEVGILMRHLGAFLDYARRNSQPEGKEWTVACLTFYAGQETRIREELQKLTRNENGFSNFHITDGRNKINIKLHTVDKFQGHEADIVFLSMVQTARDGFMDNPNRLNVAITRAKFQLVIIGHHDYFLQKSRSDDLRELAQRHLKTRI